jgi:hypothetical protein
MKRRQFIAGLGSTAATWPLPLSAQQVGRVRRIGIMLPFIENDPAAKTWLSKFVQGLQDLGWAEGLNLRIDIRWSPGSADQSRIYAKELVSLQPERDLCRLNSADRFDPTGDAHYPDRICACFRPGWLWLRGKSAATRRKHYRVYPSGTINGGKVARIAHGDCAQHQACRFDVQSGHGPLCQIILPSLI